MRKYRWQAPLTLVFIVLGIFLSLQYQSQNLIGSDLSMQRTENLIAMVRGLSEKRQKLALEIVDLNMQFNSQQNSYLDESKLAENLISDMNKMSFLTGSTTLNGSGLIITIGQSMPILYIDIIDIVNELWAAGAEAITINDVRINGQSVIFYTEDDYSMYITVNNTRLEFPVVIKTLGEPNNLEKGLTLPGGIIDTLALFKAYPILEKSNSLTMPPVFNQPSHIFLSEYKPPEQTAATEPAKTP